LDLRDGVTRTAQRHAQALLAHFAQTPTTALGNGSPILTTSSGLTSASPPSATPLQFRRSKRQLLRNHSTSLPCIHCQDLLNDLSTYRTATRYPRQPPGTLHRNPSPLTASVIAACEGLYSRDECGQRAAHKAQTKLALASQSRPKAIAALSPSRALSEDQSVSCALRNCEQELLLVDRDRYRAHGLRGLTPDRKLRDLRVIPRLLPFTRVRAQTLSQHLARSPPRLWEPESCFFFYSRPQNSTKTGSLKFGSK
jgi:hypothetical protein